MLVCEKLLFIAEYLRVPLHNIYADTDSMVTMHWISKNKYNLKLYVWNSVTKFQLTKIQILFLPVKFNHADLVSKPQASKEYINKKFWTTGASFLQQENNDWFDKYKLEEVIQNNVPETEVIDYQTEFMQIAEANILNNKITPAIPSGIFGVMYNYSHYYTILNIVAQCSRAIYI